MFALPDDATSFSDINALNVALAARFGVGDVISIQSYNYLVSHTIISRDFPYIEQQPQLMHLQQDADALDVVRLVFHESPGGKTGSLRPDVPGELSRDTAD